MVRTALFVLVFAALSGAVLAQEPSSSGNVGGAAQAAAQSNARTTVQAAAQPISGEVTAAESAMTGADWKTAEAKLGPYLATHPEDARALFDAGYVADSQNRLDDAEALYRRSIEADRQRFLAHLSLGLLLARRGKEAEARPELLAATTLDAGDDRIRVEGSCMAGSGAD